MRKSGYKKLNIIPKYSSILPSNKYYFKVKSYLTLEVFKLTE